MANAPIVYSFFGVGSGTLGTSPFTAAPFVITIFTNTSRIVSNTIWYPTPTPENLCSQATASIATAGLPTAILEFGLSITALSNPQANLFRLSVGLDPDALIGVASPQLKGYALATSIGPVFGTAVFSQKPYPTTTGDLLFTAVASAAFQATLMLPTPETAPQGRQGIPPTKL